MQEKPSSWNYLGSFSLSTVSLGTRKMTLSFQLIKSHVNKLCVLMSAAYKFVLPLCQNEISYMYKVLGSSGSRRLRRDWSAFVRLGLSRGNNPLMPYWLQFAQNHFLGSGLSAPLYSFSTGGDLLHCTGSCLPIEPLETMEELLGSNSWACRTFVIPTGCDAILMKRQFIRIFY